MRAFHVYILRCADGSYYVGHTDDMVLRMQQHENGDVGYTSTRKPVELLWQGEFETREGALAFELQVKGWTRAEKEALMAGDWERVQELARARGKVTDAPRLRQAQPERVGASAEAGDPPTGGVRTPQSVETRTPPTAQPELVEGRPNPVQNLIHGITGQSGPIQRRALSKAITLLG